jgi:UPF0755 protein
MIFKKTNQLALLLSMFLIVSGCDSIGLYLDGSKTSVNDYDEILYIPTGVTLDELADILLERGIIDNKEAFVSVGEYKKLTANRLAAGKYSISAKTDFKTLLNGFTLNNLGNGNAELEVSVTFNNCRDIPQLAGKVAKHIEADSAEIANYILSDSILNKYGFSAERIGALFLPNTYRMYWDTDAASFVERMAKEFKAFWTDERKAKLAAVGLRSQSDAVTLASIVYKEQDKHKEEWPIIARLYLNRIQAGWPLQSDPTFRFCWGDKLDGVERLTYEHRAIDCPYNTYIYAGLPPGPICIPPSEVVDAVLNPSDNDYLFMCAKPKGDGLHNFTKSLVQHNKNAKAFQNWLNSIGK